MNTLGQVLIMVSVLSVGVVYGTDVFSAIALRPALALVDERTLVSAMGRVHEFADRRMRLPGVAGLLTAIAGTAVVGLAGHAPATILGAVAIVALAAWLVIYARISAPINARLTAAARRRETPNRRPPAPAAMGQRDHRTIRAADAGDPGAVHRPHHRLKKLGRRARSRDSSPSASRYQRVIPNCFQTTTRSGANRTNTELKVEIK